jgi:bidirectional [NiFe] hydrogenase diaphorase subunit
MAIPVSTEVVTLKLNDRDVSATRGQTILEVAREHGVDIPTLCFLEGLTPWGACRMCMIELKGSPKLLPACTTKAAEGMEILSESDRLKKYRKMILELLFAERNHVCSVCVSNGRCELQDLAQKNGVTHVRFPYRYAKYEVDSTHDLFRLDHNRCIMCTRCVRVCHEIEGAHVWDLKGRGIETQVVADNNLPWGKSESCTRCGKCIHACPVGALVEKTTAVNEMKKRSGFLPYLTNMRENRP